MDRKQKEAQETRRTNAKSWAKQQAEGGGGRTTAVRLPDALKPYKLEEGTHDFDVMPFIAGEGNPRADKGFIHFEREYERHSPPTPDGGWAYMCCSWGTFKKPCTVCKKRNERGPWPKGSSESDPLRGQTRHLFIVNDKPGDVKNPLKVLDATHYNRGLGFGEQLVAAINSKDGGEDFADLRKGFTVRVTMAKGSFQQVTRIDLVARNYKYPSEMLKEIPCPDAFLVFTPESEMLAALGESSDSPPANGKPSEPAPKAETLEPDEDDDDDDSDDDEKTGSKLEEGDVVWYTNKKGKKIQCEVAEIGDDGKLTLENDDGDEIAKGVDPAKVEKVEDEPEEKEPEDSDDDDDDSDSDDDDDDDDEGSDKPLADEDNDDGDDDEDDEPAKPAKAKEKPAPANKPDKKPGKK